MALYIAADHTGLALKEALLKAFPEAEDMGAFGHVPDDDYPDLIAPCAARIAAEAGALGIVIGGSGHGEAMVANRIQGVRAATFYGPREAVAAIDANENTGTDGYDIVRLSRMHNDANVLSIGARFVTEEEAIEAVRVFTQTPFSGDERHVRRIGKF